MPQKSPHSASPLKTSKVAPTQPTPTPTKISLPDPNGQLATHYFLPMPMSRPLILGMPWLQQTNPDIHWDSGRLFDRFRMRQLDRQRLPWETPNPKPTVDDIIPVIAWLQTSRDPTTSLPPELDDFQDVFHLPTANTLAPRSDADMKIILMDGEAVGGMYRIAVCKFS
ncbi:hypothetical protein ACJ73_09365 [Blastomyces percursus]|uniref:Uncharacterized protein n=1 Tax=Blastomyces percursus TaxID=1658174 RepID=A0A1J9P6U3_9EURO|nr:hypothetical protein ACJ73_09365 [Blastomyces percursus]